MKQIFEYDSELNRYEKNRNNGIKGNNKINQ